MVGDFNKMLTCDGKMVGRPIQHPDALPFTDCLETCHMIEY